MNLCTKTTPSPLIAEAEYTYISNGAIQLSGIPNTSGTVSLFTPDPRVVYTDVQVDLLPCPPGFFAHDNGSSTVCTCQKDKLYRGNLMCSSSDGIFNSSLVLAGNWIGYYNYRNRTILVCGGSPYTYGLSNTERILPNKSDQLDLHLCGRVNRMNVLCGECIDNFGPAINSDSYTCKNCTETEIKYSWVFFLLSELLPLTVFFFILVLFNVSLTSGPANAFIFFSQIITSSFLLYSSTTTYSYTVATYETVYYIWNLNFLDAFALFQYCLHPQMGTLTVIALEYVVAIYPLVLILLLYSIIWLYNHGVRPVVCVCRPVHHCLARVRRNWDLSRSVIDSFAAFVLLSYNKFVNISLRLLAVAHLYNQSGEDVGIVAYYDGTMKAFGIAHAPYVVLALLMLLLFVVPPPLILLLYPLRVFHALVNRLTCRRWETGGKIQLFLNAFYGCFKDGTEPGSRDLDRLRITTAFKMGPTIDQHSMQKVVEFLNQMNMTQYSQKFEENGIGTELLLLIDDQKLLPQLGVDDPLDCLKIVVLFKRYINGASAFAQKYPLEATVKILSEIEMSHHGESLIQHKIDAECLSEATPKALIKLGIQHRKEREKIKNHFVALKKHCT